MYSIIKNVIASRRYELGDMLGKIDTIWLQGDLTDAQRTELVELAQASADPANSYAPLQEQLNAVLDQVKALEERVAALEAGEDPEPAPDPEEWPEWYAWNGIGKCPWQNGSKCTRSGVKYISHVDNNIWEPGAAGVHENIWEAVAA